MPKTLERTRKAIAKKKGAIESLHQYSRDSKRLHRAQVRDEKLEKIAAARRKKDQPYSKNSRTNKKETQATQLIFELVVERVAFFQEALSQNGGQPLGTDVIHELIKTYVLHFSEVVGASAHVGDRYIHQYDEELAEVKKARRPGQPAKAREDLLKVKIAQLQKEYQNGFRQYRCAY